MTLYHLLMADEKKNWNVRIYESLADDFDQVVKDDFHGDKGDVVSAALLMFLAASKEDRMWWVECVKIAEVRMGQGESNSDMVAVAREVTQQLVLGTAKLDAVSSAQVVGRVGRPKPIKRAAKHKAKDEDE